MLLTEFKMTILTVLYSLSFCLTLFRSANGHIDFYTFQTVQDCKRLLRNAKLGLSEVL